MGKGGAYWRPFLMRRWGRWNYLADKIFGMSTGEFASTVELAELLSVDRMKVTILRHRTGILRIKLHGAELIFERRTRAELWMKDAHYGPKVKRKKA